MDRLNRIDRIDRNRDPRRRSASLVGAALLVGGIAAGISGTASAEEHVVVHEVAADPADVGTIDGVIAAFYEVISGPAGEPRQWGRDRSLYIPDVRFVFFNEKREPQVLTHQQYVDDADAFLRKGFWEKEIHRETARFGDIAHVFTTYESRSTPDGPVTERGVNSLELFWDGGRWWVASVQWDRESADHPIPAHLLP